MAIKYINKFKKNKKYKNNFQYQLFDTLFFITFAH